MSDVTGARNASRIWRPCPGRFYQADVAQEDSRNDPRIAFESMLRCRRRLGEDDLNYKDSLEIVLLLEIMNMNLRDAELASGARQTIVGLPQGVTQQEAFERALGLLPARQLIAVKYQPIVVRKDDLLFVLGGHAIEFVAEPGVFEVVQQFA